MANEQNLKPFQKGDVGNPKGRPKGSKNRSTIAKKWLEVIEKSKNPITSELEDLTQEDLITLAQINKARKGDVQAYNALMDSAFGKAAQQIDHTVEKGIFKELDLEADE